MSRDQQAFTVVIPARFASTRLEGKPLIDLHGKPMVQHVAEKALASRAERVIVATDHPDIERVCKREGIEVVMTSSNHPSGSDRLWEVVEGMSVDDQHVIVNVQGDEPLMPPVAINQVAELATSSKDIGVATLCEPLNDWEDVKNPNYVKVVFDSDQKALYFSRAPIPWDREKFSSSERLSGIPTGYWRHLGIYAYQKWALQQFVELEPSVLEISESLEQLRLLQNGIKIRIAQTQAEIPGGVDTPDDVVRVRDYLANQKRATVSVHT